MQSRFFFHSDAGHGWLAVKRTELQRLGIEDEISPWSFEKGGTVYLEEDSDADKFVRAYCNDMNCETQDFYNAFVTGSRYRSRSQVRSYARFQSRTLAGQIGRKFKLLLLEEIGEKNFADVQRRNRMPEYKETGSCASHDFCDANMVMADAMKEFGYDEDAILNDSKVIDLWNSAWAYAKRHGLN